MEESAIDINISSLEEQNKTATPLEDVYGYKVLTEEFQQRIDAYNLLKKQQQQLSLEYVFTQEPEDNVIKAFHTVMRAEMDTIIGHDYTDNLVKQDNIFTILGFTVLGAIMAGLVWVFIEMKRKGKKGVKTIVTMEICSTNQRIDIQIDQKQRIKTTLRVLAENRVEFLPFEHNPVIRIKNSGRRISTDQTYEDAGIYNGTILLLEKMEQ